MLASSYFHGSSTTCRCTLFDDVLPVTKAIVTPSHSPVSINIFSMAFAQLTYRESLRDIEACLRAQKDKLYHMGIRGRISKSTLADANENRDWRIYADFAQSLIRIARPLYANEDLGLDLDNTLYTLDASTIDLCLSVFPWALFRSTKSTVKLHTLLDLRGNIPTFIHISDGKLHDVNVLDILLPEPGAFYIMDRGYVDFERLFTLHSAGGFFVIRTKSNTQYKRRYSHPTDKSGGIRCDQTIVLTSVNSTTDYPQPLRRVKYHDVQTGKTFNFLTNNFAVPAQTVADLYLTHKFSRRGIIFWGVQFGALHPAMAIFQAVLFVTLFLAMTKIQNRPTA